MFSQIVSILLAAFSLLSKLLEAKKSSKLTQNAETLSNLKNSERELALVKKAARARQNAKTKTANTKYENADHNAGTDAPNKLQNDKYQRD